MIDWTSVAVWFVGTTIIVVIAVNVALASREAAPREVAPREDEDDPIDYGVGNFEAWEIKGRVYLVSSVDSVSMRRKPKDAERVCGITADTMDDAARIAAQQLGIDPPPPFRVAYAGKPDSLPEL